MPDYSKTSLPQLFCGLPIEQPPGEDYFLARVIFPGSIDPGWSDGFVVAGPWKAIRKEVFSFLARDPRARTSRIHIAQGDDAREHLAQALAEEQRYQEEKRTLGPNN